jgi:peptide/nickel transport system permease protein
MGGFLLRRLLQAVVVILGVVLIMFVLGQMVPGGEARSVLGPKATPPAIAHFNHIYGFDQPLWVQFWHYILGLIWPFWHPNLGYSFKNNQPVTAAIAKALPKTLVLVGISTIFALVVAIPLGILQVVRRNKPIDYGLTGFAFVLYAMPDFLIGTILIVVFAFDLEVLPVAAPSSNSVVGILQDPRAMVLPVLTLASTSVAAFSRYMRSSMMDALTEDFVRTAKAKGASSKRVLYGHALRNAIIPIITLLGLALPAIVGGAVITETLFNYPGMGLLAVQAAENTDIPLLLGTTLVATVATVVGSLLADVLYAVADPRIRFGAA